MALSFITIQPITAIVFNLQMKVISSMFDA